MQALQAIRIIRAAKDALSRIPENLKHLVFFGLHDRWAYSSVDDNRRCKVCSSLQAMSPFHGTHLRQEVAGWLAATMIILDAYTIGGPDAGGDGMMHPNCRCRLRRETPLRYKGKKTIEEVKIRGLDRLRVK